MSAIVSQLPEAISTTTATAEAPAAAAVVEAPIVVAAAEPAIAVAVVEEASAIKSDDVAAAAPVEDAAFTPAPAAVAAPKRSPFAELKNRFFAPKVMLNRFVCHFSSFLFSSRHVVGSAYLCSRHSTAQSADSHAGMGRVVDARVGLAMSMQRLWESFATTDTCFFCLSTISCSCQVATPAAVVDDAAKEVTAAPAAAEVEVPAAEPGTSFSSLLLPSIY